MQQRGKCNALITQISMFYYNLVPRSSLESRHRPTGGRWLTVQISRGPKMKVGSRDLGL